MKIKGIQKFGGIFVWGGLFVGIFAKAYSEVIWGMSHVPDGDTFFSYGVFQYFVESTSNGVLPYWNFFGNGGGPFYFLYSLVRLLDPLMIIPVLYAKSFPETNLLHLYLNFTLLREFVYVLGVGVLVCNVFSSFWIQLALAALFSWLTIMEPGIQFIRDSIGWTPWILFCLFQAYRLRSKTYLWCVFYLLGILVGAASYHMAFTTVGLGLFLFFYSFAHSKEVMEFVKEMKFTLLKGGLLFLALSLPLLSIYIDREDIFPVARAYGSRDHFTETYERTGKADVRVPFEDAFSLENRFAGSRLNYKGLKSEFTVGSNPFRTFCIFLFLLFVVVVRANWKWPVLLTLALMHYFAAAVLPGYRFLYEHVIPFTMVRHTLAFTFANEIILILLFGYVLNFLSQLEAASRRDVLLFWGMALAVDLLLGNLSLSLLSTVFLALHFTYFSQRRVLVPLCVAIYFITTVPATVDRLRLSLHPASYFVHGLNDIYASIAEKRFSLQKFDWKPFRSYAKPRPAYLLFEDLILKEPVALTTVLEPPKHLPGEPYTRFWKDPVVSNRTILWASSYLDIYLLGERNFPAFLDLMGVNRNMLQFFPKERVLFLPKNETQTLFSNFHYTPIEVPAKEVKLTQSGFPRLPFSSSNPPPSRLSDPLPQVYRVTDSFLFIDRKQSASLEETQGMIQPRLKQAVPKSTIQMSRTTANSLEVWVDAPTEGYFLFNDAWDPYWKASVDGRDTEISRANIAFKAVALSPGKHLVKFEYFPTYFAWSVWIYIACNFGFWSFLLLQSASVRQSRLFFANDREPGLIGAG